MIVIQILIFFFFLRHRTCPTQVKKGDEPKKPTRKQVAKTRFVKAGGGVEV